MSRVAVVAPNTLLGRELRERLDGHPELAAELRLLSSDEAEIGQLAASGGAAAFVQRIDPDTFESVDLAFFCGPIDADRSWIRRLPATASGIVLSSGASSADAVPMLAGTGRAAAITGAALVPHPAAYGAAVLLSCLARFDVRGAQGVAALPVSMHGEAGLETLFEQTRAMLAFQSPKRGPLRGQIAFNVTPSDVDAEEVERQLRDCLQLDFPVTLQLLEAGVFHGVGLSLRVELEAPVAIRELRRALGADPRIELARKATGVSPVALAGSERMIVGEIRPAGGPGAYWIWAAFDNLVRGGALAAIELAEELLGSPTPPS